MIKPAVFILLCFASIATVSGQVVISNLEQKPPAEPTFRLGNFYGTVGLRNEVFATDNALHTKNGKKPEIRNTPNLELAFDFLPSKYIALKTRLTLGYNFYLLGTQENDFTVFNPEGNVGAFQFDLRLADNLVGTIIESPQIRTDITDFNNLPNRSRFTRFENQGTIQLVYTPTVDDTFILTIGRNDIIPFKSIDKDKEKWAPSATATYFHQFNKSFRAGPSTTHTWTFTGPAEMLNYTQNYSIFYNWDINDFLVNSGGVGYSRSETEIASGGEDATDTITFSQSLRHTITQNLSHGFVVARIQSASLIGLPQETTSANYNITWNINQQLVFSPSFQRSLQEQLAAPIISTETYTASATLTYAVTKDLSLNSRYELRNVNQVNGSGDFVENSGTISFLYTF